MEFKFPDVGEGITEGVLVAWHVKVGDAIKSEQNVASIETDKAVVDIPSPVSGIVEKLFYKERDTVYVGKPLMAINDGKSPQADAQTSQTVQMTKTTVDRPSTPSIDNSSSTMKVTPVPAPVYASANDQIQQIPQDQPMRRVRLSEVLAMPAVRREARLKNIDLSTLSGSGNHGQILMMDLDGKSQGAASQTPREMLHVTASLASNTGTESSAAAKSSRDIRSGQFTEHSKTTILATPSTRQMAREMGVDITAVHGTGDYGAVTKGDLMRYGRGETTSSVSPSKSASRAVVSHDVQTIPMSSIRQTISRRMMESVQNTAQYSVMDEADVTDLVAARERIKDKYEQQGIKLTYLPFIIKAVIAGCKKYPVVNSSVDEKTTPKSIMMKSYFNIGIATDTPDGLVVPVIRDADVKTIVEIAQSITDIAGRARERKLRIDELSGSTFTITNLGNSFGQAFTPVINYPEAAILGIGRIVDKPVAINGQVVIRKVMTLSLTADHRIIDGAIASRFMNEVKLLLENPVALALEL